MPSINRKFNKFSIILNSYKDNLIGVCSEEPGPFPHSSRSLTGVGGCSGWFSCWSILMDVLGSQELNFDGSESLSWWGEPFNFEEAFRSSTGVSTRVPQALRNLACKIMCFSKTSIFQQWEKFKNLTLILKLNQTLVTRNDANNPIHKIGVEAPLHWLPQILTYKSNIL